MKLNYESIQDRAAWERVGVRIPDFDWKDMYAETYAHPTWVHFGSGSLFRAFHSMLQQSLVEQGLVKGGLYAAETFDYEMVEHTFAPYDNLTILVNFMSDGTLKKTLVNTVAGALRADPAYPEDYERLKEIFRNPSLQLITFTITEKGYALRGLDGAYTAQALADFQAGPHKGKLAMSKVASMLLERFRAGKYPMAVVSTDNCSHNGEKVRLGVTTMAEKWLENGLVEREFVEWVEDENNISFPWTMIDKITPRPAESVAELLTKDGIEGMAVTVTKKGGYTAPFVNAEKPQYLVIEDRFPNGRPPLEKAGAIFTDRETVNKVERMKVTTCLNPPQTALAVFGCLLGYTLIADEMKDPELVALSRRIGYDEGMPVVTDPGVISPKAFIDEVYEDRLPNPYLPDTPQRIASDTSQKVAIRFGETIKAYLARPEMDVKSLVCIPLTLAGWLRYLLAVDDEGKAMTCSIDPMLAELQGALAGVELGKPETLGDKLRPILTNAVLFGTDLYAAGLGETIEAMTREMLAGPGAVRATLKRYLA